MAFGISETVLASLVESAGTFTVGYPAGMARADFVGGVAAKISALQTIFTAPEDFTVSLGASSVTVTWGSATDLAAGTVVKMQLDAEEGSVDVVDVAGAAIRIDRANPVEIRRLDLGNPAASDDDYFRASASISAGGALTLLQTVLDFPRNIIITNAGDDSADTYTVTGEDEYGVAMIEIITGANAGIAAGKKAFKTVSSIVASGASASTVKVGFGDVLGLPVWVPSSGRILKELQDDAAATAGTLVGGLSTNTKSTATTADVRGTYDPNAACDGSKSFAIIVAVSDPNFIGNPQYDG